ncbi:hypothetical protein Q760_02750 [Cellulomonas cellasea DSM 20118]|uniref:Peptidoglycan recognition protein family domain-containing protein n=1 Tax=Cellulomonas cellasea DSM 20118 TaxID=1408250 RepID=A0A0A0B507_9CELL|nr:hypothetical protein Q760_02750 [Cellulomonas cellasea DSM 20118]
MATVPVGPDPGTSPVASPSPTVAVGAGEVVPDEGAVVAPEGPAGGTGATGGTDAPTSAGTPTAGDAPTSTDAPSPAPADERASDAGPATGAGLSSVPVDATTLPAGVGLTGTAAVTTSELTTDVFHLAAVTWAEPDDTLEVSARVRSGDGWTEWQHLEAEEGAGADSGRGGTAPLIDLAGADGIQVQLASPDGTWPSDVRIDLVDPGEETAADPAPGAGTSMGAASTVVSRPSIITRAQWGADESINTNNPSPARALNMAFIHHTATTNSYGPGDSAAQIRSIYVYHVQGRGWPDIGYNFVVDRYGQVFEGRSGGIDLPEVGAHAGDGFNTGTVGVAALGTFSTSVPDVVPEVISQVVAWKFGLHQVDPYATVRMVSGGTGNVRWGAGTEVYLPAISGHRHSSFTDCPGEALYAALPAVRARTAQLLAQAAHAPWLAGSLDGVRVRGNTVTAYGWSASTERPGEPVQVTVRSWSRSATTTTGVVRTDVAAAFPQYGNRAGFEASLELPRNTYQVCVDVTAPGRPAVTLGCGYATVMTGMVLGNVDLVTPRSGGATIQGWALQPGEQAPNKVHLYVDGAWGGQLTANVPRADVAAVYPAEGPNHGFAANLTLGEGPHDVCAYGISLRANETNPLLGCRRVVVPSRAPVGNLEAVVGSDGAARLIGWTFDPDTSDALDVHVYRGGAWAGSFVAGGNRPDVARAFGLTSAAHGLTADVALPPGQHAFCAYAINRGSVSPNPSLGCRTVGVPLGNPFGSLDIVERVTGGAAGETRLRGWVIDPDTRAAAAVHVYVDGWMQGAYTAGAARADVGSAYPTLGAGHGYDVRLRLTGGTHNVCVYAINTGVGTTNPLVGCRTVTV